MVKLIPPWAEGGTRRLPTTDEQEGGFGCGAADRTLFNGLFHGIQAELRAIQDAGGIAGSEVDNTTVLQAILALIDAATGGGTADSYVLMTQARARLPIHADSQQTSGGLDITTPATGQVRIPAGKAFLHRGIYLVTTMETDLATAANKTYHLRWNPVDGFALYDLADVAYNPTIAAETSAVFDSTFDDILWARIVTSGANVVTVTNLTNKPSLLNVESKSRNIVKRLSWTAVGLTDVTLNWGRTPTASLAMRQWRSVESDADGTAFGPTAGIARSVGIRIPASGPTRYNLPNIEYEYQDDANNNGWIAFDYTAMAL